MTKITIARQLKPFAFALLADVEEIALVRLVDNPRSLLDAVADESPDAVLTDIRMTPTFTNECITAAKRIRAEHPQTGVVVLPQYFVEEYAFELLEDGWPAWAICSRSDLTWSRQAHCAARPARRSPSGRRRWPIAERVDS